MLRSSPDNLIVAIEVISRGHCLSLALLLYRAARAFVLTQPMFYRLVGTPAVWLVSHTLLLLLLKIHHQS